MRPVTVHIDPCHCLCTTDLQPSVIDVSRMRLDNFNLRRLNGRFASTLALGNTNQSLDDAYPFLYPSTDSLPSHCGGQSQQTPGNGEELTSTASIVSHIVAAEAAGNSTQPFMVAPRRGYLEVRWPHSAGTCYLEDNLRLAHELKSFDAALTEAVLNRTHLDRAKTFADAATQYVSSIADGLVTDMSRHPFNAHAYTPCTVVSGL